jgi:Protein of unknown function with PCYCGC motif
MHVKQKMVAAVLLVGLTIVMIALPQHAAMRTPKPAQNQSAPGMDMSLPSGTEAIPKFHAEAPRGVLPDTLDPTQFSAVVVQNAYTVAAKIKKLLYQQPCYCHCDQSQGHNSLLDCFAGKHGSGCNVCMGEDFYAYEQSHQNKTAAQIRAGIIRGDWKTVDLSKYTLPLATTK